MDGTGPVSYPVSGFNYSGVEPSGSGAGVMVILQIVPSVLYKYQILNLLVEFSLLILI